MPQHHDHDHGVTRRVALTAGTADFVAATAGAAAVTPSAARADTAAYADPAPPQTDVEIDLSRTALVVTDPQIDFLNPDGVTWGVVGESATEHGTAENIERLMVVISPHYY